MIRQKYLYRERFRVIYSSGCLLFLKGGTKRLMKKSLYKSIILSVAVLGLGAQITSLTTVKADEVPVAKSEPASKESTVSDNKTISQESENSKPEKVVSNVEAEQGQPSKETEKDIASSTDKTLPLVDWETPEEKKLDNDQPETIESSRINANETTYRTDVEVPYVEHDKSVILDEKNNVIDAHKIYDGNTITTSGEYTGDIYYIYYDVLGSKKDTVKNQKLKTLTEQAMYFLKSENYGYSNYSELVNYFIKYQAAYDRINSLNDDGTPVVNSTGHHSSSNNHRIVTEANGTDQVSSLTIITNKQATLFTEKGDKVTNRGLYNKTIWQADKVSIINNQLMYRISPTEWVSAGDVNLLK